MKRLIFIALSLILLATILIRFAEPVGDGDLFWQMAYGHYMVDHFTLIPDHTIYSWTPSTNATIYCSWVAEIFFYLAYQLGGLPLIFAFRYACVIGCVALVFNFARRLAARDPKSFRLEERPEIFLLSLLLVLGSYVGTILKPEIFSLVGFNLLAWGYFCMKLQAREGADAGVSTRWLWFFPILMLVWVNSHGVFMFGLLAMLVLCGGEWMNRLWAPELSLPFPYLKNFTLATALSGLACFLTPYGYRYPLQLFRELESMVKGSQSAGDAAAYASLAAHQKITAVPAFHFLPIMVFMTLVLLFHMTLLAWQGGKGRRADFAIMGVNLLLVLIYFWYVRTTYYWPAFFAYSALYYVHLLNSSERGASLVRARLIPSLLAVLAFLGVAGLSVYQSIRLPYASSWCGFGVSYWNPVYEAEWLARFDRQARIYNDYDGGGYLLWRLYPQTKVMIDPRSFPYRQWYAVYNAFEQGQIFNEFLDQMEPCDLAVISHKNLALCRSFAHSGKWVVAWMGPSSVIFCRPGKQYPQAAADYAPNRYREIKSFGRALDVFQVGLEFGLYNDAFAALRAMSENFGSVPEERQVIVALTRYKDALTAENAAGDLDKALRLHEECAREAIFFSQGKLMELYKWKLQELTARNLKGRNDAEIRDLAIRMNAVAHGDAPPISKIPAPPPKPSPVGARSPVEARTPLAPATPGEPATLAVPEH